MLAASEMHAVHQGLCEFFRRGSVKLSVASNATAPTWRCLRDNAFAHDDRDRMEAFSRFASRNAVVAGDERQRNVVTSTAFLASAQSSVGRYGF